MKEFILVHQPGSVEPTVIRMSLFDIVVAETSPIQGNITLLVYTPEYQKYRSSVGMSVTESPDEIFKKLNEE